MDSSASSCRASCGCGFLSSEWVDFKAWLKTPSGKLAKWRFILFWVIQYIFVLGVTVIIAFIQHPLNLFAIYEYGISLGLAVHLAYWIISVKLSGKSQIPGVSMVYAPKQTVIICDDKKKPEAMKCITAMEDVTKGQAENLIQDVAEIV